jgi:hypothetical protein
VRFGIVFIEALVSHSTKMQLHFNAAVIHTYKHTYIVHGYVPTYVHTYTHTYEHTYMHTYTHTCMHTYIYIYTHTCYTLFKSFENMTPCSLVERNLLHLPSAQPLFSTLKMQAAVSPKVLATIHHYMCRPPDDHTSVMHCCDSLTSQDCALFM